MIYFVIILLKLIDMLSLIMLNVKEIQFFAIMIMETDLL